jgi:hypothetical protein
MAPDDTTCEQLVKSLGSNFDIILPLIPYRLSFPGAAYLCPYRSATPTKIRSVTSGAIANLLDSLGSPTRSRLRLLGSLGTIFCHY